MKKILLAFVFAASFATIANAQEKRCYSSEMNNEAIRNNPALLRQMEALENFTQHYGATQRTSSSGVVYVIPVVFHILHNYGPENISDAQIHDAMRILNRDYRKLNPDTVDIVPSFVGLAADCEIEFRLASIDPNGNCTNGIDRIVTQLTYSANDASKLNPWPNDMYLNIWVANSLENTGAAAYAYYPGSIPSNAVDGVISLHNYVGSIGTSSEGGSRTLTHEVGHCLNLAHVWGSTNQPGVACGDDGVSDTPITKGHTSCQLSDATCNPPIIENVQNYMEYSFCENMFTEGQKTRMRAALNNGAAGRNNLWQAANLLATGVTQGPQLCTPIADFGLDHQLVCAGGDVTFYDLSWHGDVSTWDWSFPGGVPSTSADSAPVINYPTPGIYPATLIAINATGSDTLTKTQLIFVSGTQQTQVPYSENFEDTASFPGNTGFVLNNDGGVAWARVTNAAVSGTACLKMNNYTNIRGQIDEWVMPTLDFSNVTSPVVMTFFVANAQRNSTTDDQLVMAGSLNCGATWTPRYTKSGATLATVSATSAPFTPSTSQWRMETVSLNSYKLLPNVRLKFKNTSDRGNNTYIDSINITGTLVNVDDIDDIQLGFALYPNPTTGSSKVQFQLSKSQNVTLEVRNILGETIKNVIDEEMQGGIHEISLPSLPKGIYMIDLITGNKHHVRRLIVS